MVKCVVFINNAFISLVDLFGPFCFIFLFSSENKGENKRISTTLYADFETRQGNLASFCYFISEFRGGKIELQKRTNTHIVTSFVIIVAHVSETGSENMC